MITNQYNQIKNLVKEGYQHIHNNNIYLIIHTDINNSVKMAHLDWVKKINLTFIHNPKHNRWVVKIPIDQDIIYDQDHIILKPNKPILQIK